MDVIKCFQNLQVYNDFLQNTPVNDAFKEREKNGELESKTSDSYFTGTPSWENATERLISGDKESADKIKEVQKGGRVDANIHTNVVKPKMRRRMAGFMPSVPAYCAGAKRCMYRYIKETKQTKVLTICYNIGALCGVSSTDIARSAFNVLKAVLRIEASGTRVNFYTSAISESCGQACGSVVKIKDSSQYFNFLKMAYPMVHPSMFRRQAFRFKEVAEGVRKSFSNGYGSTISSTDEIEKRITKSIPTLRDAIFLGFYEVRRMDEDGIFERIKAKALNKSQSI